MATAVEVVQGGEAMTPENIAAQAYPEHSCYEWNHQHYLSRPEYLASQCGVCGRITGFMWRKKWRRIVSCFTPEQTLGKGIKYWVRGWLHL